MLILMPFAKEPNNQEVTVKNVCFRWDDAIIITWPKWKDQTVEDTVETYREKGYKVIVTLRDWKSIKCRMEKEDSHLEA